MLEQIKIYVNQSFIRNSSSTVAFFVGVGGLLIHSSSEEKNLLQGMVESYEVERFYGMLC